MEKLVSPEIRFHIEVQRDGGLIAYFEQNNLKYGRLSFIELDEIEYFVGDSPISDTISGNVDFQLIKNENEKRRCPYEIKLNTNLVRNRASSNVYEYVDRLFETLNLVISDARPVQIDVRNELEEMGWHMSCN